MLPGFYSFQRHKVWINFPNHSTKRNYRCPQSTIQYNYNHTTYGHWCLITHHDTWYNHYQKCTLQHQSRSHNYIVIINTVSSSYMLQGIALHYTCCRVTTPSSYTLQGYHPSVYMLQGYHPIIIHVAGLSPFSTHVAGLLPFSTRLSSLHHTCCRVITLQYTCSKVTTPYYTCCRVTIPSVFSWQDPYYAAKKLQGSYPSLN